MVKTLTKQEALVLLLKAEARWKHLLLNYDKQSNSEILKGLCAFFKDEFVNFGVTEAHERSTSSTRLMVTYVRSHAYDKNPLTAHYYPLTEEGHRQRLALIRRAIKDLE